MFGAVRSAAAALRQASSLNPAPLSPSAWSLPARWPPVSAFFFVFRSLFSNFLFGYDAPRRSFLAPGNLTRPGRRRIECVPQEGLPTPCKPILLSSFSLAGAGLASAPFAAESSQDESPPESLPLLSRSNHNRPRSPSSPSGCSPPSP